MWRIASAFSKVGSSTQRFQSWQDRGLKSLAISVYFKHPDLGMDKHDVLIRSSAFLLAVDPPNPESSSSDKPQGMYNRLLEEAERKRQEKLLRRESKITPAGGPKRHVKDLGWLEFCPQEYRPIVHVFTSRHVLAPWDYYPHYFKADFLQIVRAEHCIYVVEVYDTKKPGEPAVAKFDLNPYPVLHPLKLDMAMIHLKDELTALERMKELGVEILHLREDSNELTQGEELLTDGYELADPPDLDMNVEDTRYFVHIAEPGMITGFTDTRYFMHTPQRPLPEGSCGGPVSDEDGRVAGIVEAIISPDQAEESFKVLIGQASILPPHLMAQFIEWSERQMLQQIVPKHMFEKIVDIKAGNALSAEQKAPPEDIDTEYEKLVAQYRKRLPPEKFDALLATIQRDKSEVLDILDKEGGDLDEVEAQVREKSWKTYESILEDLIDQAADELEASTNASEAANGEKRKKDQPENESLPKEADQPENESLPKEAEFVEKGSPKEAQFVEKTSPPSQ